MADRGADSWLGRIVADRYRIDAELGHGGMGHVYRAHHLHLHRPVAIKVLRREALSAYETVKRFEREARAVSKLDHPNCVQIMDFGHELGQPYLVMQLLEGQELRQLLGAPFEPQRAVALARQILMALEHAHRRGVVHRDLKPENVFIVRDDHNTEAVKLVDFGIAKLLNDEHQPEKLTQVGVVYGTPMYISPEQATGSTIDERADLYGFGILLYEMLTGKPPFVHSHAPTLLQMHVFDDPAPLPDGVPHGLAQVVMRCLAKTRDERFESAHKCREALESWQTPHLEEHHRAATAMGIPKLAERNATAVFTTPAALAEASASWRPPPPAAAPPVANLSPATFRRIDLSKQAVSHTPPRQDRLNMTVALAIALAVGSLFGWLVVWWLSQ